MNEEIRQTATDIVDILEERNKKYGDTNLLEYGTLGLIVRMSDKIARIRRAIADVETMEDDERAFEVIEDALIDLAGYAINGLRLLRSGRLSYYGRAFEGYKLVTDSDYENEEVDHYGLQREEEKNYTEEEITKADLERAFMLYEELYNRINKPRR